MAGIGCAEGVVTSQAIAYAVGPGGAVASHPYVPAAECLIGATTETAKFANPEVPHNGGGWEAVSV